MFSVTVRRSTFTIRSTIGIRMKRPGPFGCGSNLPRRKTIPRSYSRATLIAEIRNSTSSKSRTATTIKTALTVSPFEVCEEGTRHSECARQHQVRLERPALRSTRASEQVGCLVRGDAHPNRFRPPRCRGSGTRRRRSRGSLSPAWGQCLRQCDLCRDHLSAERTGKVAYLASIPEIKSICARILL